MGKKFDPDDAARLESPERAASMPPERTLRRLGVRRGMTFADVGAGTGFFTLAAADLVGPEGRVYALDVEGRMLAKLRAKGPPPWVETALCGEGRLPLPDGTADFAFSCFVFHEAADPEGFLREMGRVAKRRAPVVVLEWAKRRQPEGPPFAERIHHHELERMVLCAGLAFRRLEFFNPSQYAVWAFRR